MAPSEVPPPAELLPEAAALPAELLADIAALPAALLPAAELLPDAAALPAELLPEAAALVPPPELPDPQAASREDSASVPADPISKLRRLIADDENGLGV
ncbi:MAG: hypothetical protein M3Y77_16045 [Actinomycetota bacterium]|nr:hypothetical protein [Actinomycetota bacterium]